MRSKIDRIAIINANRPKEQPLSNKTVLKKEPQKTPACWLILLLLKIFKVIKVLNSEHGG